VFVESEFPGDPLAILEDLETRGELHGRHVAGLFEQWQVAVGLHVTGDAGIAVPVPGPADVTALLAEPHVVEPSLPKLVPEQQAGEAGADNDDFTLVGQG